MRFALRLVSNVSFGFESAQDCQYRRISQIVSKVLPDFAYSRWAMFPQDLHDFGFAIRENNMHYAYYLYKLLR